MAKKRGNVNRLLNPNWVRGGATEWKLWDREGQLWGLVEEGMDRSRTERLFLDAGVPVAISEGAAGMVWVESNERRTRWRQIAERAFDPGWQPPPEAPGAQPFEAMRFENQNGDTLLLLHDHD